MTKKPEQDTEQLIALADLKESAENGRIVYDEAQLKDLMQSIKGSRLEERLVVRPVGPDPEGGYEIVDGHRRYRALQRLGWTEAPCLVRNSMTVDEARLYRVATIFQRAGATPYEEARYLAAALRNEGMNRQKLSQACGIKPGTLKARLEILEFPEEVARRIGVAGFGMEHARVLAQLANKPDALAAALAVVDAKDPDSHQTVQGLWQDVKRELTKRDLARDPGSNKLWNIRREFPTFEGQAGKLDKVELGAKYGSEVLVTDVEAFDALVAKAEATLERRREKEAKAEADPAEVKRRCREEREARVAEEARKWLRGARREAAMARLAGLAELSSADLGVVVLDVLEVGIEPANVAEIAHAAGIPGERLAAFVAGEHEDPLGHELIAASTSAELTKLVVAVFLDRALHSYTNAWPHIQAHWTGKTDEEWDRAAAAAGKAAVKAAAATNSQEAEETPEEATA